MAISPAPYPLKSMHAADSPQTPPSQHPTSYSITLSPSTITSPITHTIIPMATLSISITTTSKQDYPQTSISIITIVLVSLFFILMPYYY